MIKIVAGDNIRYRDVLICLLIPFLFHAQVPLPNGHAHNDYEHERPLLDALELGYTSIEVDIHSYKKTLRVCHDREELVDKPELEELYLNPLKQIIRTNDGTIYINDSTTVVLMIDFKTRKRKALRQLASLLDRYESYLTTRLHDTTKWGPLQIILSGDPPLGLLKKLNRPYFYIDGRFGSSYPEKLKTMIAKVSAHYDYVNLYEPDSLKNQWLRQLVSSAHSHNKKIRFWATKDDPILWQHLMDHGVDWISVDDLKGFAIFRKHYTKNTSGE